jgi:hypothetical protein
MLPFTEKILKKEAQALISESKQYLKTRNVEYEMIQGIISYRITGDEIGVIRVRPEDIDKGQLEAINQDCDRILPRLTEMDSKISEVLIREEIIPIRKWEPIEFFTQSLLRALMKKKQEQMKEKNIVPAKNTVVEETQSYEETRSPEETPDEEAMPSEEIPVEETVDALLDEKTSFEPEPQLKKVEKQKNNNHNGVRCCDCQKFETSDDCMANNPACESFRPSEGYRQIRREE